MASRVKWFNFIIVFLLIYVLFLPWLQAQNVARADSVTQTVELENTQMRVVRTCHPSGHLSLSSTHLPRVMVVLKGFEARITDKTGVVTDKILVAGNCSYFSESLGPRVMENLSNADGEVLFFELKLKGQYRNLPEKNDVMAVDSKNHSVEFENDLVRIIRGDYPPGIEILPHVDLPGATVFLSDARVKRWFKGQAPVLVSAKAGKVGVFGTGKPTHAMINLGNRVSFIRVEIKTAVRMADVVHQGFN